MRANLLSRFNCIRLTLCVLLVSFFTTAAWAHPMGNFSVSHYSSIDLQSHKVVIHYFIDLAEIPTYQELQQANIEATANAVLDPSSAAILHLVANRGAELADGLSLRIAGNRVPLRLISSGVIFPPGAGGLPTMKMGFVYEAVYPPAADRTSLQIDYADNNYPGHSGWKEMIATSSAGRIVTSSVPSTDRSNQLSNYPTDLLSSPPQALEATMQVSLPLNQQMLAASKADSTAQSGLARNAAAGKALPSKQPAPPGTSVTSLHAPTRSPAGVTSTKEASSGQHSTDTASSATGQKLSIAANQQHTPRNTFTELITQQHLSLWFLFTAAIIAIGLGALHALEPGHGKTIVAAYLVGSRGTARHAVLLGLIVTASHTVGVFALGAVTLYASRYIVPEQLYPWLGVFSGVIITGMGCYMFLRRWTGTATDHSHAPGSSHAHWPFGPKKTTEATEEAGQTLLEDGVSRKVSLAQLFTLGITGGIIPCPAALIVLLSAFALHRIALGFFLIVSFSLGLAAVLIGFGMTMVYARRFIVRLHVDGPLTTRWLPLASSAFITLLGAGVAIQAFTTTQFKIPILSADRIGPLLFVAGLGLVLGMRHSTDADHVVAISTIVSKQRSIRGAALIGSVWGLGHTITIFAVGSLIILFGVEIPPRIGLGMEFCVALMLIVLGILNLTGVLNRITTYFASTRQDRQLSHIAAESKLTIRAKFDQTIASFGWYQCVRPLVIGLVHGLAGSAAVALLVLSTIHNPYWATAYLIIFGIGTMIGMMCMTAAIAVPLTYAGARFANLGRYFGVASGVVSLCFGSFLVYQLGFLGGLFTSHPQWTPR